jgi:hypothetical protein
MYTRTILMNFEGKSSNFSFSTLEGRNMCGRFVAFAIEDSFDFSINSRLYAHTCTGIKQLCYAHCVLKHNSTYSGKSVSAVYLHANSRQVSSPQNKAFIVYHNGLGQCQDGFVQSQKKVVQSQKKVVQSQKKVVQSQKKVVQSQKGVVQCQKGVVQCQKGVVQCQKRVVQCQKGVVQCQKGVVQCQKRVVQKQINY